MRALSIYSFIVACICTAALAFSCVFLAPKASYWLDEVGAAIPIPSHVEGSATLEGLGLSIIGGAFILGCVGFSFSLITPIWRRFGGVRVSILGVTLSGISLLFLCWHGFALWWTSNNGVIAHRNEASGYRKVLEEFTILEEAEGRMAAAKERFRQLLDYEPQPITDPSQMSRSDANTRLTQLLRLIQQVEDPATTRRILATTSLFPEPLARDQRKARIVLERANGITGQEFSTVSELHEWIALQPGEEWEPITLYGVSAPNKGEQDAAEQPATAGELK